MPETTPKAGATYEIRVKGHLSAAMSHWFEGLTVTAAADGHTLIRGQMADQAALHGWLARIRDLGLPLMALNQVTTDKE